MNEVSSDESPSDRTSVRIRRATDGDAASLAWIVERFSPLLLAQARYRLGVALRRHYDPEDLVADVWAVALRRMSELRAAADGSAGAFVRYLGTVLLRRARDVARLAAVRRTRLSPATTDTGSFSRLDASTTSVATRAMRDERNALLTAAIDDLAPLDRQVVILRGVEGVSLAEASAIMGVAPNAIATRYHRALKKLRAAFPNGVLEELADD